MQKESSLDNDNAVLDRETVKVSELTQRNDLGDDLCNTYED